MLLFSDQIEAIKGKMESHQTDKMKAERQCQEAQTKLEVLSKYFKEKEAELTRYWSTYTCMVNGMYSLFIHNAIH